MSATAANPENGEHHILIVDADAANNDLLAKALRPEFTPHLARTSDEAFSAIADQPMTLAFVAENLPNMTGGEFLRRLQLLAPDTVRVLLLSDERLASGEVLFKEGLAQYYLPRQCAAWQVQWTVRRALEFRKISAEYTRINTQFQELFKGSLSAITDALEAKDPYTYGHSYRVTQYALAIGRQIGLPKSALDDLELGGLLHDVGKISIPESILQKTEKLTEEEYALIKTHPHRGQMMLWRLPGLSRALSIVRHHQERFDGKGYPDGLRGDQIPVLARILTVADAYDAMTSNRPYRKALSHAEAIREVEKNAGTQFDPRLVKVFLSLREMAEVRKVIETVPDLPAFSPVVKKAMNLLAQDEPDLSDLGRLLSSDVGMTAKLLRVVNSASFALPRTITDLREALTFIGIHELYRLLVAVAARPMLGKEEGYLIWWHSLKTAYCAEALAQRTENIDPNSAFIAGLFHDMGKVLLVRYFPQSATRIAKLVEGGTPNQIAEIMALGVDHAEIGAWLMERWELSADLCSAVRSHHTKDMSARPLTHLVALANLLAHVLEGENVNMSGYLDLFDRFDIDPNNLNEFRDQVQSRTLAMRERISALV